MVSQARKYRGYRTQDDVAAWFAERGWPNASSVGAGRPGADIVGVPRRARTHVEVKARGGFAPLSWLRQTGALAAAEIASSTSGALPGSGTTVQGADGLPTGPTDSVGGVRPDTHSVVFRCNGQGPATLAQYGVLMTLWDYTILLQEAGRL